MGPASELQSYEWLLCGHLRAFEACLRKLSPEHWDWAPAQSTPSARILASHAWQWLVCDRYHITLDDPSDHPRVPDVPDDTSAICACLAAETKNWTELLRSLTVEDLDRRVYHFGDKECEVNVRYLIAHIIQNTIYKNGQFMSLYYALGYDGDGPYTAPFPNAIYEEIAASNQVQ